MEPLAEAILVEISALPEGMPVTATALLHLGSRPAVSRAFSRLMRRGKIYKISRGVYVASVVSRFGSSAPSLHKLIEELSKQLGETLVPSPAFSANALGLTTQVPVRAVYLTSGRSRKLTLGKLVIELQHAPSWHLTLAEEPAGEIIRALAWSGPEQINQTLKKLESIVPRSAFDQVSAQSSRLPPWVKEALARMGDG
jgi:hypothetical protein